MGFTKLDEGILQSSIMAENSDVFKVWIAFLASCKEDGLAPVSAVFIASVCHLSQEVVDEAVEVLSEPDPHSRTTTDDGRRIRRVDGGFELVNYQKYRDFSHSKAKEAERKREYRARKEQEKRDMSPMSANVPDISASASCINSGEERMQGEKQKHALPEFIMVNPDLHDAWDEWVQHRKEKKKPMTPLSMKKTFKQMEAWGPAYSIKVIEYSIRNGWQGLYEPKEGPGKTGEDEGYQYRKAAPLTEADLAGYPEETRKLYLGK